MPNITIDQSGCRACNLCVEICPTDVLEMDSTQEYATVVRVDDCIGCTSCLYLCPSRCLEITDFIEQRPFYRIEENQAIISKFLQKKPATSELTAADYSEALGDVSTRLIALAATMVDTLGRGQKALGRQSGKLSAEHLPEMYESATIPLALEALQRRFANAFDFDYDLKNNGEELNFKFSHCALKSVVENAGETVGDSTLCTVFHEYWAGLVGSFAKKQYIGNRENVVSTCEFNLKTRG
jgi:NAD-dependent dihydropyrimidine dehydrogenase PreA subunit